MPPWPITTRSITSPSGARIDALYAAGLLSAERYFDEPLEWEFYELWHHEGRRARMGAAMMAPDYAWWHGFYELKHRFNHVMDAARDLAAGGVPSPRWDDFPGRVDGPRSGAAVFPGSTDVPAAANLRAKEGSP